ncbi:unnamed protein product [Amoebophrya sp. A25]|nr:unnamed protein product [Amoebophrya sp. A25]|eukprot:GSA25T00026863001.1
MGNAVNQLAFPAPDPRYSQPFLTQRRDVVRFQSKPGTTVIAVDMANETRSRAAYNGEHFYVLYSHGNAEDIGLALPYLEQLAKVTDCSILAYEYEGYSLSDGEPTEEGCYRSINAAYKYLTKVRGIPGQRIFVFGRSIGSGPSTDLVSRCEVRECAGLILQSPIESGATTVLGQGGAAVFSMLDIFRNIDKVDKVQVTACIIHGMADEVVPFSNGRNLHEKLAKRGLAATPLWVPGAGHNNMPEKDCLLHVRDFIRQRVDALTKTQRTSMREGSTKITAPFIYNCLSNYPTRFSYLLHVPL